MEKFIGKEVEVLIERNIDGDSIGHTSNFLLVKIPNSGYDKEEIVNVKITDVDYPYVIGK